MLGPNKNMLRFCLQTGEFFFSIICSFHNYNECQLYAKHVLGTVNAVNNTGMFFAFRLLIV